MGTAVRLCALSFFALKWVDVGATAEWGQWSAWSEVFCANATITDDTVKRRTRKCEVATPSDGANMEAASPEPEQEDSPSGCSVSWMDRESKAEDRCGGSSKLLAIILATSAGIVLVFLIVAGVMFKNYRRRQIEKSRRLRELEKNALQLDAVAGKPAEKHRPAWFAYHFSTLRQLMLDKKLAKEQKLNDARKRPMEVDIENVRAPKPKLDKFDLATMHDRRFDHERLSERRDSRKCRWNTVSRGASPIANSSCSLDLWNDSMSRRNQANFTRPPNDRVGRDRDRSPKRKIERRSSSAQDVHYDNDDVYRSQSLRRRYDPVNTSSSPRYKRPDRLNQSPRDKYRPVANGQVGLLQSQPLRQKRRRPLSPRELERRRRQLDRESPFGFYRD